MYRRSMSGVVLMVLTTVSALQEWLSGTPLRLKFCSESSPQAGRSNGNCVSGLGSVMLGSVMLGARLRHQEAAAAL